MSDSVISTAYYGLGGLLFLLGTAGLVALVQTPTLASEEDFETSETSIETVEKKTESDGVGGKWSASKEKMFKYLTDMGMTTKQANLTIEHVKNVRDPDHFISWFGAIFRHENGGRFIDGQTNYLAGRLKPSMRYQPFKVQLDGWVQAYNKYWYQHDNTYGRINLSRYCVSDYHGGKGAGCPNWKRNVPKFLSKYNGKTIEVERSYASSHVYPKARKAQDEANRLRKLCKETGECKE